MINKKLIRRGLRVAIEQVSWSRRVAGAVVDWLIIFIIMSITFVSLNILPWSNLSSILLFLVCSGIFALWYFIVLESFTTTTIGKKLVDATVVSGETYQPELTATQSIGRNLSKIFLPLLIIDWLVGVAIAGNNNIQRASDKFTNTYVVSSSTLAPATARVPIAPLELAPTEYVPRRYYYPLPSPTEAVPTTAREPTAVVGEEETSRRATVTDRRHGRCPRCNMPLRIEIMPDAVRLVNAWCNRCTWCNKKLM